MQNSVRYGLKASLAILLSLTFCSCENPQNFDSATPPALPNGWLTSGVDGQKWITVADSVADRPSDTPPNSAFVPSFNNQDVSLTSPLILLGNGGSSEISFKHRCKTENGFDGMILEASVNGAAFSNIESIGTFLEGPYSNISPILGISKAWTGESNYVLTRVALPNFAASTNIKFKFRSISDNIVQGTGCSLDSLNFKGADLLVTSTVDKAPLLVNEEQTYTISVKNLGQLPATDVRVIDVLPSDFILNTISLSQGIFSVSTAPVLNANVGNLAVGQTATMTIKGKISNAPVQAALLQLFQTNFLRNVAASGASFGPALQSTAIKSSVFVANDGTGDPEDGCESFPDGSFPAGTAVLMRQSNNCSFNQQVKNAELGGAAAAIIFNATNDQLVNMASSGLSVSIPSVFIGATDGLFIRNFAGLLQSSLISLNSSLVNEVITTSSVFDTEVNNNFATDLTTVISPSADLKARAQALVNALAALKPLKPNASATEKAAQSLAINNLKSALGELRKAIKTSGASIILTNNSVTLKTHNANIKSSVALALKLKSSFAKDKKSAVKSVKNLLKVL